MCRWAETTRDCRTRRRNLPTMSLESVLITSTIEAFEVKEVAVVDIPGAYLSADMDEEVIMLLRGRFTELMVKTAPNIYR
jgi:hypothetical protein